VPNQIQRYAGALGETDQPACALTHLRHTAGRRLQRVGVDGLNRIDDEHGRTHLRGRGQYALDIGFGQQCEIGDRQLEAFCPQSNLGCRFLAADIQRIDLIESARSCEALQQERGLADPGVAAEQHHRALHETAAEYPVQLPDAGVEARRLLATDVAELLDARRSALFGRETLTFVARAGDDGFDDAVPGFAFRALSGPFRCDRATGLTLELALVLHGAPTS